MYPFTDNKRIPLQKSLNVSWNRPGGVLYLRSIQAEFYSYSYLRKRTVDIITLAAVRQPPDKML